MQHKARKREIMSIVIVIQKKLLAGRRCDVIGSPQSDGQNVQNTVVSSAETSVQRCKVFSRKCRLFNSTVKYSTEKNCAVQLWRLVFSKGK